MEHDSATRGGLVASPGSALLGATVNHIPATAHAPAPWQPSQPRKTTATVPEGEAASPPPRPPRPERSRSHSCDRDDAGGAAATGPARVDDYTTPMLQCAHHDPLPHDPRDGNGSCSVGAPTVLQLRSEDAVTPRRVCRSGSHDAVVDLTVAPATRTTAASPGAAVQHSERNSAMTTPATTMLGTTVQLMEATTMSLSPSVHRPATSLRMTAAHDAGVSTAWDREPSDSLERHRVGRSAAEAEAGVDPLAQCVAPVSRESEGVRVSSAIDVSAGGRSATAEESAVVQPVPPTSSSSQSDSDDEDERSLFHETVLFMNNTLHSLGSTRRTPSKPALSLSQHQAPTHPPHQPSHEAAGSASSPTPHLPRSLEVTPSKAAVPPRHARDSTGPPDRAEHSDTVLHASLDDSGSEPPSAGRDTATAMALLRTATGLLLPSTQHQRSPCTTAPVSPATTANTHAALPTPNQLFRADPELAASSSSVGVPPAAVAARTESPAAAAAASEYIFIDNHDGTAYLADASLQLDGSYALGETILLARGHATSGRVQRTGGCETATEHDGAVSPVVVPQSAAAMPQQRANAAHRPLRGAQLPTTSPASVPFSPGSPVPHPVAPSDTPSGTPVSPSIARVLVRRSAAPSRDTSLRLPAGGGDSGVGRVSRLLPSTFSESFCFDQTLLVPLEPTRRSPAVARGSCGRADADGVDRRSNVASPAVVDPTLASPAAGRGALVSDASFALSEQSCRSAAPPRWEASVAAPVVFMPALSSPAVSLRAGRRERGVSRPSPSCEPSLAASSVYSPMYTGALFARASPVPDAPCAAAQLAQQEARATREARALRPDHDVMYLIPAGAATQTVSADDIARQGWIPVQIVLDTPAPAQTAQGAARDARRARSYIIGGGAESPLPKNPAAAQAHRAAAAATDDGADHNADAAEEANDGEGVEREPSLSRRSYDDGAAAAASPPFSPASTLSASTLDCINRRLSYSMSHWASARQRFGGGGGGGADASLAGSVALPPATPLHFAVPAVSPVTVQAGLGTGRGAGGGRSGGHASPAATLATAREGSDAIVLEPASDSRSPLPLPPGSPELPQREPSPSRCADATGRTPSPSVVDRCSGGGRGAAELGETACGRDDEADAPGGAAGVHVDPSSLLTSMSFQRPSTALTTASESYAPDGSFSIPLTSSASMSVGVGARHPYGGGGGGAAAGYLRQNGVARQTPHHQQQQQPHQLRAPHPRRMSANTFANATPPSSASVSMRMFGEGSLALQGGGGPAMLAAGNASFRTTFCNNRSGATSVGGGSLSLGAGDGVGVAASAGGLPLSRGTLGTPSSAAAGTAGARGVLLPQHYPPHRHHYPHQRVAGLARTRSTGSLQSDSLHLEGPGGAALGASGGVALRGAHTPASTPTAHRAGGARAHPYTSQQHLQQAQRAATARVGPAGHWAAGGRRTGTSATTAKTKMTATSTATSGARVAGRHVPDTSVFLPWAPLTITPDGSLNLDGGGGAGATQALSLPYQAMTLMPFTSSGETSMMTTTTTTTITCEETHKQDDGPHAHAPPATVPAPTRQDKGPRSAVSHLAAAMLRTAAHNRQPPSAATTSTTASHPTSDLSGANAVHAAGTSALHGMTVGAAAAGGNGGLNTVVNKDAFVSSFLQHAASQAPTSVDGSLTNASVRTMTTTTTTKSVALSRASMVSSVTHTGGGGGIVAWESVGAGDGNAASLAAAMEATMNHFQASLFGASAAAESEPEPRAPSFPGTPPSPTTANGGAAAKENFPASTAPACGGRRSASNGATRGAGLREGSAANVAHAVRLSGKTRSPSYRAHHGGAAAAHAVPPPPSPTA